MIVTLIPYCPTSEGKNLGFAYNELMDRLRENDWACFIDHDACFTTSDWYPQLEEIIAPLTEPCVLTATTNRVGSRWQLAAGADPHNHSMEYHRRFGKSLQSAARGVLRDVTHEPLMSGVVILLSKKTWRRLGGFADGFLGVDNAIHQAARDQGYRVLLMMGLYVYHWYRADADLPGHDCDSDGPATLLMNPATSTGKAREGNGTTHPEEIYNQISDVRIEAASEAGRMARADWKKVPVRGHRILLIGHDVVSAGEDLKERGPASLTVVEVDERGFERSEHRLDHVQRVDSEGNGVEFPDGSFDGIIASDLLENLRRPEPILRKLRRWLDPNGRFITRFRTVRSLRVVEGLLEGRWLGGRSDQQALAPIRFYTRREFEKLFYRTGFCVDLLETIPGPNHSRWVSDGCPDHVHMGRLYAKGLPRADIEEFHSHGFLLQAAHRPQPEFGRTSIIIITFNQIEFTIQCVESIKRMTDEPYELIFVDNGSTDGTAAYLESIGGARVIRNQTNRGFPAAVNQGIEVATGEQVLLFNNDTVVTTGWLARMLATLASDPKIGLVGPCSNYVGSEQQVNVNYDSLAGLDGFAWEMGKTHDRAVEDTHRLIGFCLLIRRAVVDEIGLLDERFGIGCFEDDDYCLRAIRAGWRAVIARDAFVHHFGGRTFLGNNIDLSAILRENEKRFRDKWSADPHPGIGLPSRAGHDLPQALPDRRKEKEELSVAIAPSGRGLLLRRGRTRLSLCMIVRDSAATLRPCLASIRPWVDEMVVVDTGSKDETPRIAEELGARLFHFPWCDDFSAARNESLRHATGEWLFWMDSDDTIPADCGRQLRELAHREAEPNVLGYVMQVHCPGPDTEGPSCDVTIVDHVKLFRNRPDLLFDGRVHEQILPAIRRAGGTVAWTKVYVVHSGSDPSAEAQDRKRRRDLHLLHLELRERPQHPFTLFNLGMTYVDGGRFEEAEEFLRRSLRHSNLEESHLRKVYALLVCTQSQLGRRDDALSTCRAGRALFPEDAELRFREGILLHELGRLGEAAQAYRDVLTNREERHFSSIDHGLTGFKAHQNLAAVYTDMGDLVRAEAEWREVTRAMPRYRPGWRFLSELLLRTAQYQEVKAVAELCLRDPVLEVEGYLIRGRLAMANGDAAGAQAEFDRANAAAPGDRAALEARCQILFEHGRPSEAEAALKTLIDCQPEDASAYHNLGMLMLRSHRNEEAAQSFRQSLRHRADAPATYLHLGLALKESGRLEEAVSAWQQVLRLAPDNVEAREELRRAGHFANGTHTGFDLV